MSIVITTLGVYFSPYIINSINNDKETLELSIKYIHIIFFGSIFIFILMSINSSLSAQGDTKSYRNVLIFSFFLNIFLNPILISGKIFSFQLISPLGIQGIAYATIISQFVGIFYLFIKLTKTSIYNYVKLTINPNFLIINNILSQGIPASIGMMMIAIGSYILIYFVGFFGVEAIAGYTSAGRYEQLFFLPLLGLSTATVTIVGQNFGAKQYQRVLETYKKGIKVGVTEWFESEDTRNKYQERYGDDWWWKLNETHDLMIEKVGKVDLSKSDGVTRVKSFSGKPMIDKRPSETPQEPAEKKESLWANIHKKRQRIKQGSGERMRKKGEKGAPTSQQMKRAKGEQLSFEQYLQANAWGEITEDAEYQGKKVKLNNPTRGDVKKFKVYVRNDKGNVVKVEYGDPNMEIKRDDPARRKSFRARHNCDNPGPKYKARYWSCKFWSANKSVSDLMKG